MARSVFKAATGDGSTRARSTVGGSAWPVVGHIIRGSDQDRPSRHHQSAAEPRHRQRKHPQKPGPLPKQATMATTDLVHRSGGSSFASVMFAECLDAQKSEQADRTGTLVRCIFDADGTSALSRGIPVRACDARRSSWCQFPEVAGWRESSRCLGFDRLGDEADANDVRRRVVEFGDAEAEDEGEAMAAGVDHSSKTSTWLDEVGARMAHTHLLHRRGHGSGDRRIAAIDRAS